MGDDTNRLMAQREAYAIYVRLQWQLIEMSRHDPAREMLAAEVAAANRRWRALAGVPETRVKSVQQASARSR